MVNGSLFPIGSQRPNQRGSGLQLAQAAPALPPMQDTPDTPQMQPLPQEGAAAPESNIMGDIGTVMTAAARGAAGESTGTGGIPDPKSNPLGAIGFVLQSIAAGAQGKPLPGEGAVREQLQRQGLQLRALNSALSTSELFAGQMERVPQEQRAAWIEQKAATVPDFIRPQVQQTLELYNEADEAEKAKILKDIDGLKNSEPALAAAITDMFGDDPAAMRDALSGIRKAELDSLIKRNQLPADVERKFAETVATETAKAQFKTEDYNSAKFKDALAVVAAGATPSPEVFGKKVASAATSIGQETAAATLSAGRGKGFKVTLADGTTVQMGGSGDSAFSVSPVEVRNIRGKISSARTFVQRSEDLAGLLEDGESALGASGKLAQAANSLAAEIVGLKNLAFEVNGESASAEDVKRQAADNVGDEFFGDFTKRLGRASGAALDASRIQGFVVELAFAAGAAKGQTGRAVSDKDVERFIRRIGQSADPGIFKQVLDDARRDVVTAVVNDIKTLNETSDEKLAVPQDLESVLKPRGGGEPDPGGPKRIRFDAQGNIIQ